MNKLLAMVIIMSISCSGLFAQMKLYHDSSLQFSFFYPDKWEITENNGGNIKLNSKKSKDFPFIGITVIKEEHSETNDTLRDFYLKADKNLDAQYNIQFMNFQKEHAKLAWMNGNIALYYQFKFTDSTGKGFFGKQVMSATGFFRYTVFLATPDNQFDNYDEEFERVIESFFGYNQLGISQQGSKNFIEAQRAYYGNDYVNAENLFSKVIESDPDFCESYLYKGLSIQAESGYQRIGESSSLFGQAVMRNPQHFPAMNQVALCWAAVANPETEEGVENMKRAFKVIDDAINVNSFSEETLLNKASLLINIGNYELGMQFLNRILELNPRHKEAQEIKNKLNNKLKEVKNQK